MANSSPDSVILPTSCELCPRLCRVNRAAGNRGYCGSGNGLVVARAALHEWEEPPISGNTGSGTIFFSGCSLKCVYCQNAQIALGEVGRSVTCEQVADMCLRLQDAQAMNINMVTATHVAPLVRASITIARKRGLHLPIVWNTSGYETPDSIEANKGYVDVYLSDFKYASPHLAMRYSKALDYPDRALVALRAMVQSVGRPRYDEYLGCSRMTKGVIVRHLMLPGCLEDSKHVVELVWKNFGQDVTLSLMNQYTPLLATNAEAGNTWAREQIARYPELKNKVSDSEYDELLDYADSLGIENYFWQQGGAAEESFIPAFDLTGVL